MESLPTIVLPPARPVKAAEHVAARFERGPRGESRPIISHAIDPLTPAPLGGAA